MKLSPMKQTLADALGTLVGRDPCSVTFVRDYVQLAFDGPPGLNAYTMPTVTSRSENLNLGQPGYRDSLPANRLSSRTHRS
jgi:hypothetical protein